MFAGGMYASHGAASAHVRPGVLRRGESLQAAASNPVNDVVAAVSQLQVHFWVCSPGGGLVYLSSLDVPNASLDEDPAVHALWHPHRGNHLAIVTSRRVIFMEADLHPPRQDFLGFNDVRALAAEGNVCSSTAAFCEVQSRVCFSEEVAVDNGIVSSVSAAGPAGFLVNTTAGVVYIIGWSDAKVLHTFTVASLRSPSHSFVVVPRHGEWEEAVLPPTPSPAVPEDLASPVEAAAGSGTESVSRNGLEEDAADGVSHRQQPQPQHDIHHRILTGAILHATFEAKLQLFSFVLSSGYILLARASCGVSFASAEARLSGSFVAATAACSSILNGTHLLLAVATHAGSVSCYRLQQRRGQPCFAIPSFPLWRRNGTHSGDGAAVRNHGPISSMEWSPGRADALCVGFFRVGMVVVHWSGACLVSSFSTEAHVSAPTLPQRRTPGVVDASLSAQVARSSLSGCLSVHWCHHSRRIVAVEPQSCQLVSFKLSRPMSPCEVGPHEGVHTPLCWMDDDGLFVTSYTAADGPDAQSTFVPAPLNRSAGVLPLRHGAMDPSGNCIAVAGRKGLLVYSRHSDAWRGFPSLQDEAKCVCVCDPAWLGNSLVAVAMAQDKNKFCVAVFPSEEVSWAAVVARQPFDSRPISISVTNRPARGDGFLVVQDVADRLHVLRFNMFTDDFHRTSTAPRAHARVVFTPLRCIELETADATFVKPLAVWPVCMTAGGIRDGRTSSAAEDVPCLILQLRAAPGIVLLNPLGDDPLTARAKQFQKITLSSRTGYCVSAITPPEKAAFAFWVDRFSPLDGLNMAVHEEDGFFYYHMSHSRGFAEAGATRASSAPTSAAGATASAQRHPNPRVDRVCIATREGGVIPLCLSPFDGVAVGITECREVTSRSPSVAAQQCYSFSGPSGFMRPILVAPRVLGLVLQHSLPTVVSEAAVNGVAVDRPDSVEVSAPTPSHVSSSPPSSTWANRTPGPGNAVSAQVKKTPSAASAAEDGSKAASGGGRLTAAFAWDEELFRWLQTMRENGSFVASLDCFLMSALDDSPPGGIPQLDRKNAVRAVVSLLRNYPEFYEIMVGCVRKIDMSRWHVVLDFLGSPLDLYQECIDNGRFTEAVHLVRVIMMTGYGAEQMAKEEQRELPFGSAIHRPPSAVQPPQTARRETLEQACACAITLFDHTVRNGDFSSAYDLLRFTALVRHEIGMPAAVEVAAAPGNAAGDGDATGGSTVRRWLRTLMGGGGQTDGPEKCPSRVGPIPIKGCTSLFFMPQRVGVNGEEAGGPAGATADGAEVTQPQPRVVDIDEAEQQQRLAATRMMFTTYPALPAMVEREASHLFQHGHLLRLCRLLETFSLCLDSFLQHQCGRHGDSVAAASAPPKGETGGAESLRLACVFDGLHAELGLPRSGRAVGLMGSRALCEPDTPILAQMALWSQAQVTLYGNRRVMETLSSLQTLFSGRHVYFDLAFALIRMAAADLIAILTGIHEAQVGVAEEWWTPARLGRSAGLLAEVAAVVRLPANRGYGAFLDSLVDSLPPTLLKASGHVAKAAPSLEAPHAPVEHGADGSAEPTVEKQPTASAAHRLDSSALSAPVEGGAHGALPDDGAGGASASHVDT